MEPWLAERTKRSRLGHVGVLGVEAKKSASDWGSLTGPSPWARRRVLLDGIDGRSANGGDGKPVGSLIGPDYARGRRGRLLGAGDVIRTTITS